MFLNCILGCYDAQAEIQKGAPRFVVCPKQKLKYHNSPLIHGMAVRVRKQGSVWPTPPHHATEGWHVTRGSPGRRALQGCLAVVDGTRHPRGLPHLWATPGRWGANTGHLTGRVSSPSPHGMSRRCTAADQVHSGWCNAHDMLRQHWIRAPSQQLYIGLDGARGFSLRCDSSVCEKKHFRTLQRYRKKNMNNLDNEY